MQIKPDHPLLAALVRQAETRVTPPRPAPEPALAREAARAFFAVAEQKVSANPVDHTPIAPRGGKLNIVV